MRRSSLLALACSGAMAATLVAAAPSQAVQRDHAPQTVVDDLVGPLSLAVHDGSAKITVDQSFAGIITSVDKKGRTTDLASYQGTPGAGEVVGVSLGPHGTYYINTDFAAHSSHVNRIGKKGQVTTVSDDFMAYEDANNPDGDVHYGFTGLGDECTAQLQSYQDSLGGEGPEAPHLVEYTGILDSHPYKTAVTRKGDIYVADAAANAILKVSGRTGAISTVAVIPPPAPVTVTSELLASSLPGAPDCLVGRDFVPEPVPTDVEIGRDGMLYVSTLGGGLGEALPLSSVYQVDPRSGTVRWLAGDMSGATGLALLGKDIVVAQMFGGEVSVIHRGSTTAETLFSVAGPSDVEVHGNRVYATTVDLQSGMGSVVSYKVG
ncbi:ScyD/ScyE family protein [Ornithinimicrobium avium]|uniref:ScyD/ScyE family protein n=1 Tax=Ornithinimicrobium avium TaxID=2283195 RepID=A0A345NMI0_9MICO|nr:ScyD/ScyE family protein [Ornithinimicrobium avium]AXH96238.1 ScyD/ScyE family protein [Ornithinimicrobium avium]